MWLATLAVLIINRSKQLCLNRSGRLASADSVTGSLCRRTRALSTDSHPPPPRLVPCRYADSVFHFFNSSTSCKQPSYPLSFASMACRLLPYSICHAREETRLFLGTKLPFTNCEVRQDAPFGADTVVCVEYTMTEYGSVFWPGGDQ